MLNPMQRQSPFDPLAAVLTGSPERLRQILSNPSFDQKNLETRDSTGKTALFWAAMSGHEAMVDMLLKAKADINAKDDDGYSVLMRTIEYMPPST
jgi:ankyrin repeat protein